MLDHPDFCYALSQNAGIDQLVNNELKYQTFIKIVSACQKASPNLYE